MTILLGYEKPSTSSNLPPEPPKPHGTSKVITTFQSKVLSQVNSSVFAEDDPYEEKNIHVIKAKLKPFEITAQVNEFHYASF
jgi:hypothetical protein